MRGPRCDSIMHNLLLESWVTYAAFYRAQKRFALHCLHIDWFDLHKSPGAPGAPSSRAGGSRSFMISLWRPTRLSPHRCPSDIFGYQPRPLCYSAKGGPTTAVIKVCPRCSPFFFFFYLSHSAFYDRLVLHTANFTGSHRHWALETRLTRLASPDAVRWRLKSRKGSL